MKICVASHIVLDEIQDLDGQVTESFGGPVCYGALIAKTFGLKTSVATRVGMDILDKIDRLKAYNISLKDSQIEENFPTTRFKLVLNMDGTRKLYLISKCSQLTINDFDDNNDCIVLSPVIDEISENLVNDIHEKLPDALIMLDPQGFLRYTNSTSNLIFLNNNLNLQFKGVNGIKVDEDELSALTGGVTSIDGMKILAKKYAADFVISTGKNDIFFLNNNILYSLSLRKIESPDYTGLGDILTSGFSCSYLKEKDPLWAICFGAGSVVTALQSKQKGIQKVPNSMKMIERNASYFYNMIKFKIID